MVFQPHINDDVAVVLVIVGDVDDQHGTSDGIGRAHANTRPNLHRPHEETSSCPKIWSFASLPEHTSALRRLVARIFYRAGIRRFPTFVGRE